MGYMINAAKCAEILSISKSHAYKIIKRLNKELEKEGYVVINGKVPSAYFEKKFYIKKD